MRKCKKWCSRTQSLEKARLELEQETLRSELQSLQEELNTIGRKNIMRAQFRAHLD